MRQRVMDRRPHYGLRKLSVGVASVLLSTTFFLGKAHADTLENVNTEANVAPVTAENNGIIPGFESQVPTQSTPEVTEQGQIGQNQVNNSYNSVTVNEAESGLNTMQTSSTAPNVVESTVNQNLSGTVNDVVSSVIPSQELVTNSSGLSQDDINNTINSSTSSLSLDSNSSTSQQLSNTVQSINTNIQNSNQTDFPVTQINLPQVNNVPTAQLNLSFKDVAKNSVIAGDIVRGDLGADISKLDFKLPVGYEAVDQNWQQKLPELNTGKMVLNVAKIGSDSLTKARQSLLQQEQEQRLGMLFGQSFMTIDGYVDSVANRSYGVDVSDYQGNNMAWYASKGAKYAIIKVSEGTSWAAGGRSAAVKAANAKAAGLMVMSYYFSHAYGNVGTAETEARYAVQCSKSSGIPVHSYIAMDWEASFSGSRQANTNAAIAAMQVIRNAGYLPLFYSSSSMMNTYFDTNQIVARFPGSLWVASYPTTAAWNADFNYFPSRNGIAIWQFDDNWRGTSTDGDINVLPLSFLKIQPSTPTNATVTVHFIDDDNGGKVVGTPSRSYKVNTNFRYNDFGLPTNMHWIDGQSGNTTGHVGTSNETINIHVRHNTEVVYNRKSVTRHYEIDLPNGQKKSADQTVWFVQPGTHDLVTNKTSWGKFDPPTANWDAVDVPVSIGYTASGTIPQVTVNPNSQNANVKITYSANPVIKYTVNIFDKDANNKQLSSNKYDNLPTSYRSLVPKNYEYVGYQLQDHTLTITVGHQHQGVNDVKRVSRTYDILVPGNPEQKDTQYVEFVRTGQKDLVTGQIHWNNWDTNSKQLPAINIPVISGYVSSGTIPALTVTPNSQDTTVKITYQKVVQPVVKRPAVDPLAAKLVETVKPMLGWFVYGQDRPITTAKAGIQPDDIKSLDDLNRNGRLDCSGFVWLGMKLAGEKVVKASTGPWYTGSMARDARGAKQYLKQIDNPALLQPGDIIIVDSSTSDKGDGGHTAIIDGYGVDYGLTDKSSMMDVLNSNLPIYEMGGGYPHMNQSTITRAFNRLKTESPIITLAAPVALAEVVKPTHPATKQQYDIQVVDVDENNKVLNSQKADQLPSNYDSFVPTHYSLAGYHVDNQTLTIQVRHQESAVTDSKTVTRTILIVDPTGKRQTGHQSVTFGHAGVRDDVTGKITWKSWTPAQSIFDAIDTPDFPGYTKHGSVDKVVVTPDSQDSTVTITYIKKETSHSGSQSSASSSTSSTVSSVTSSTSSSTASSGSSQTSSGSVVSPTVKFVVDVIDVDENNKTLSSNEVDHLPVSYDKLIPTNYSLAGYSINGQTLTIKVRHNVKSVTENKTVTRKIIIIDPTGHRQTGQQSVTFGRAGLRDLVTGQINWKPWDPSNESFDVINTPDFPGYTKHGSVDKVVVTPDSQDSTVTVTYVRNETSHSESQGSVSSSTSSTVSSVTSSTSSSTASSGSSQTSSGSVVSPTVKFVVDVIDVDENNKTLSSNEVDHLPVSYDKLIPTNYSLAGYSINGQTLTIKVRHNVKSVTENKTVTRKIIIIDPTGHRQTGQQSVTFGRAGLRDLVTGQINWKPWDPSNESFDAIDTPDFPGYTKHGSVDKVVVTPDSQNSTVTITYTKNSLTSHTDSQTSSATSSANSSTVQSQSGSTASSTQSSASSSQSSSSSTASSMTSSVQSSVASSVSSQTSSGSVVSPTVKFVVDVIDVDENNKTLSSNEVDRLPSSYDSLIPKNYSLAGYDIKGQTLTIRVRHNVKAVTESKTVTRHIVVVTPNGQRQTGDQSVTFGRAGVEDLVTGKTIWKAWDPANGKFDAINIPDFVGYTKNGQVDAMNITPDSQDSMVTITYVKDNSTSQTGSQSSQISQTSSVTSSANSSVASSIQSSTSSTQSSGVISSNATSSTVNSTVSSANSESSSSVTSSVLPNQSGSVSSSINGSVVISNSHASNIKSNANSIAVSSVVSTNTSSSLANDNSVAVSSVVNSVSSNTKDIETLSQIGSTAPNNSSNSSVNSNIGLTSGNSLMSNGLLQVSSQNVGLSSVHPLVTNQSQAGTDKVQPLVNAKVTSNAAGGSTVTVPLGISSNSDTGNAGVIGQGSSPSGSGQSQGQEQNRLPQTGNKQNQNSALAGLGLAGGMFVLGLAKTNKKRRHD